MNIREKILEDPSISSCYKELANKEMDDIHLAQRCIDCDPENSIPALVCRFIVDTLSQAAESGNTEAMNDLGVYFMMGRGGLISEKRAFSFFKKGAEHNDLQCIENLGFCYRSGFGTDIDEQKAYDCFIKGALLDSIPSLYNIAEMYEEIDVEFAFALYKKCWHMADEEALEFLGEELCMKLGILFLNHQDGENALYFFEKASDYSQDIPQEWINKAQALVDDYE